MPDKSISENSAQPAAAAQPPSFGRRKSNVPDATERRALDTDDSSPAADQSASQVPPEADDTQSRIQLLAKLASGVGREESAQSSVDPTPPTGDAIVKFEELSELAAGVGAEEKMSRRQGAADTGVIVTTTNSVEGYRISEYLGLVAGEAILGANLFKDMFASITDVVGGRSGSYERELTKARGIAVQDMIDSAMFRDADAIVGVDIDYEVLSMRGSMLMVMASGTAVKLVPND